MEELNRREAIKAAAAGIVAAATGGALEAADTEARGSGPCTRCGCRNYGIGNGSICAHRGCRHPYSAHRRIHTSA